MSEPLIDTGDVAEATNLLALLERDPAAGLTGLVSLFAERRELHTTGLREGQAELADARALAWEQAEYAFAYNEGRRVVAEDADELEAKLQWFERELARLWSALKPAGPPCGHVQTVVSVAIARVREARNDGLREGLRQAAHEMLALIEPKPLAYTYEALVGCIRGVAARLKRQAPPAPQRGETGAA